MTMEPPERDNKVLSKAIREISARKRAHVYKEHLTVRTHADFSLRTLAQRLADLFKPQNPTIIGHVFVECSFDPVPSPPIFSSPATSLTTPAAFPTPSCGIRPNPCATLLEGGLPGRLAGPIPHTGYEPKFCIDVDSEHTPIILPSGNMSFPQEYDVTITASVALELPRRFGASQSSSQRSAASRVHTMSKTWCIGDWPHEGVGGS